MMLVKDAFDPFASTLMTWVTSVAFYFGLVASLARAKSFTSLDFTTVICVSFVLRFLCHFNISMITSNHSESDDVEPISEPAYLW